MSNGIMDGLSSTVLQKATYSGRNKGIFLKKSKWPHFLKKKLPVLEQKGFHLLSNKFWLNLTSFWSRCGFKMATVAAILDFRTERF